MRQQRRIPLWVVALSWVGVALLFAPLLAVAFQSFNATRHGQAWGGFTLGWYEQLLSDKPILEASWNTLLVATISTTVSTVLGTLLAIGLQRTPWPRWTRHTFETALLLPVVTPDILFAVALVSAFGVFRWVSRWFEPGYLTLVVGHVTFQISFVTLVVRSRLVSIGPEQMEAARDLYASTWGAWRRVMLPQLSSALLAGALLAFTLSLDDFVITFFTSGPGSATLPLYIYASVRRGVTPAVHALSTVIVCATLLTILAAALYQSLSNNFGVVARWCRRGIAGAGSVMVLLLAGVAFAGWQARHSPPGAPGSRPVTVLMYSEYIDPALVEQFTQETGMPLRIEVYEAQEEMVGKLQAGGDALYDVVVASDAVVRQLSALGLLAPLDHQRIPNLKNVSQKFQSPPFDPGNVWSAPYVWGSTGILYRDQGLPPETVRWSDLLGPKPRFESFVLLDEARTMLAIALQAGGTSGNSRIPAELRRATDLLLSSKSRRGCLGFDASVGARNKVVAGEAQAAIVFNGEAISAIAENEALRYAVPQEGSVVWLDNMLLTARAPNEDGAHRFINFILEAENGAKLANFVHFPTPNEASLPHISAEDLSNPVVYPDAASLKRMEFLADPGAAARLWDEAWTSVKSR